MQVYSNLDLDSYGRLEKNGMKKSCESRYSPMHCQGEKIRNRLHVSEILSSISYCHCCFLTVVGTMVYCTPCLLQFPFYGFSDCGCSCTGWHRILPLQYTYNGLYATEKPASTRGSQCPTLMYRQGVFDTTGFSSINFAIFGLSSSWWNSMLKC